MLPGYLQCGIAQVADINGDGIPDIIGFNATGGCAQLGNGDGTFGPLIPIPNVPGIISVVDMNEDGRPDIVFPEGGAGALLNNTQPGFGVSASALSPGKVVAGNAASSTVKITPTLDLRALWRYPARGCPAELVAALILHRFRTARAPRS